MADPEPEYPMAGVVSMEEIEQRQEAVAEAVAAFNDEQSAKVHEVIVAIEESVVAAPEAYEPDPEPVEFHVTPEDVDPIPLPNGQQTQPPEHEA